MKEELVSFKTAKLAKEKGFDEICSYLYENSKVIVYTTHKNSGLNKHFDWYSAATQSLLQKWLREAHEIFVSVDVNFNVKIYYKDELHNEIFNFNSYEEALEKGLQEGLKLIEYENKTNTN